MNEEKTKERQTSKIWVPLVLIIGAIAGEISYYVIGSAPDFLRLPPFGARFGLEIFRQFHVILSTISISLLIALMIVYMRTYRQTKANFALGILVVLFALLFQSILTYPLLVDLMDRSLIRPGFSSPIADIFMIIAYSVFLYLSLE